MKKLLLILTLTLACLAPLTFTGCGTLDPAGVYQGDKVLYDADILISTSYDTVHAFVLWEFNNRATLASMPEIRKTADAMRIQYPIAHKAALNARSAYLSSKSAPNATMLSQALAVLRQTMTTASQYLAEMGVQ
jgi:hypothetical protein